MYRDLLVQALGTGGGESRSDDLLLADLVDSRARLQATGMAAPVAEALARELSYDGALIRLCICLDVRTTAAWFDSPGRERARLERELARRGIRLPPPGRCTRSRPSAEQSLGLPHPAPEPPPSPPR
jgi:hypothetical protein